MLQSLGALTLSQVLPGTQLAILDITDQLWLWK